ncbi:MAG: ABC transporter ATP-binding protein [Chloroflexi bacterium]|nr:ABC transporter ATP-binding protein [Chloroflexota bacterium]
MRTGAGPSTGSGRGNSATDPDDIIGKAYDPRVMGRLLEYLKPYRKQVAFAFVVMIVRAVSGLAGPTIIRLAIDEGMAKGNTALLGQMVVAYLLASGLNWVTNFTQIYTMAWVGQTLIYTFRTRLFEHLQKLTLSFYDHYEVGRIISRVIGDVGVMQEFVTWAVVGVFSDIFVLVGIIVAMLSLNVPLSLLTFTVLPLMVIVTAIWRRRARETYRQVRRKIAAVNANLNENITGVRVVQSFSREGVNAAYFDRLNREHLDANMDAARLSSLFFPAIDIIGSLATALVVGFGGVAVLEGGLTAGVLVAMVLYVDRFFDPIRDLTQRYNTLQATMASGERIIELLDTEPDILEAPDAIELPPIVGHVKVDHVTFGYSDGVNVLHDINLDVPAGQTVAFVGETGAGKSSLVALLSRFYEVKKGAITIDGYDIRKVKRESLRRQMGVVLQATFLFSGTIKDNIRYGRLTATDEEVTRAAQTVGAHEFIATLAKGYDTPVGEGGVTLSVGQRQLVSFARALLADPRILILDEATSSIDTHTEQIIQRALERLLKGRTAFVIAHRLSTITKADQIVVVSDGRIAERGSHQQLLARQGMYYDLYTMSFRREQREKALAELAEGREGVGSRG